MNGGPHRFVWGYGPSGYDVVARSPDPPGWEPECLREIQSWRLDPTAEPTCVTPVGTRGHRVAWLAFRSRLVETEGERSYVETVAAALPWSAAVTKSPGAGWLLARLPAFGSLGVLNESGVVEELSPSTVSMARSAEARRACLEAMAGKTVAVRGLAAREVCLGAHELLPPQPAIETAVAWGLAPSTRPGRPGIFVWPDRMPPDGASVVRTDDSLPARLAAGGAPDLVALAIARWIDQVASAPHPRAAWRELGVTGGEEHLGLLAVGDTVADIALKPAPAPLAPQARAALLSLDPAEARAVAVRVAAGIRRCDGAHARSAGVKLLALLGSSGGAKHAESWEALVTSFAGVTLDRAVATGSLVPQERSQASVASLGRGTSGGLSPEAAAIYWTQAARLLVLVCQEHPAEAERALCGPYAPPTEGGLLARVASRIRSSAPMTLGGHIGRLRRGPSNSKGDPLLDDSALIVRPDARIERAELLAHWTADGLCERLGESLTAIWHARQWHPAAQELARIGSIRMALEK